MDKKLTTALMALCFLMESTGLSYPYSASLTKGYILRPNATGNRIIRFAERFVEDCGDFLLYQIGNEKGVVYGDTETKFRDLDDFANRYGLVVNLEVPKLIRYLIAINTIITKEMPACINAFRVIKNLREYMDDCGLVDRPLVIWQNLSLGFFYPYFSDRLKEALGITEIDIDMKDLDNINVAASERISGHILIKYRFSSLLSDIIVEEEDVVKREDSSNLCNISVPDYIKISRYVLLKYRLPSARWTSYELDFIKGFAQKIGGPILMIDHSPGGGRETMWSDAQKDIYDSEYFEGRGIGILNDAEKIGFGLGLLRPRGFEQSLYFILLNACLASRSLPYVLKHLPYVVSYFENVYFRYIRNKNCPTVVIGGRKESVADALLEVYGRRIEEALLKEGLLTQIDNKWPIIKEADTFRPPTTERSSSMQSGYLIFAAIDIAA